MTLIDPPLLCAAEEHAIRLGVEEQIKEAKRNVQTYLDELKRVAEASLDLVKIIQDRQEEGDRLRVRLAKVNDAYEALVVLYTATLAEDASVAEHTKRYYQAKLALETSDG